MTNQPTTTKEALEPCPFCGIVPTRRDNVYQYGSIAEHPEGSYCPIANTTIGIKSWNSRVSAPIVAPPNYALVQLLEAALLHPESAEGNIRQVIEALSTPAPIAPVVDDNDRVLLEALRRVRADQDDFWTFYQADPLMVKAADRIEELLRWHSTEQSMHAAWRKRAEEAEATLAAPASPAALAEGDK